MRLRVWVTSAPVLEIPLDKQLTANFLVETCTKLKELILVAMVEYGLNRVRLPLWLQQSLINGFSWYSLSFGHNCQRTSVKCAEAAWNYKAGGEVHWNCFLFKFSYHYWIMQKGKEKKQGRWKPLVHFCYVVAGGEQLRGTCTCKLIYFSISE